MNTLFAPENIRRGGIVLIALTGLIHLVLTPEYWEFAPYLGVLFLANAVGAGVSAYGIYRGERSWGWPLGLLIAGGALVMFVISRLVGLPGIPEEEYLEGFRGFTAVGIGTMIIEILFIVLFFLAIEGSRRTGQA